jgi:sortase A
MRRIALLLIVLGIVVAITGAVLRFASVGGQSTARVEWDTASGPGRSGYVGETLTRLSFPAQGEAFFVRDGASKRSLLLGPAWVNWSASPGQSGNCIILAHRDTHFRLLKDVRKDDLVELERGGQMFRYRIVGLNVVGAADNRFYRPTDGPVLTLVTCYPFFYLGRAPKRFIVRAELVPSNS